MVEAKRECDVSGFFSKEKKAGGVKGGSGSFLLHERGEGVQVGCSSREDPVDCRAELKPDAIPEGASVKVCWILHEGEFRLPQGLTDLFPFEEKEGTIELSIFFADADKSSGTCPPKKIGQNGFDPVIFLVP